MTEPVKRILLVEDDVHLTEILRVHLRADGYGVVHAADGHQGLALVERGGWDAILLDLMLPGIDGLEICRRARAVTRYTPIIITSARGSEVHRILGLEMGADDYLPKPFSVLELLARLKALLRRVDAVAGSVRSGQVALVSGGLQIDRLTRQARLEGRPLDLTPREFDLLHCFVEHPTASFRASSCSTRSGVRNTMATNTPSTPTSTDCGARSNRIPATPCASSRCGGWLQILRSRRNSRRATVNALTLWQRLALVFSGLLLACFGAAASLQMAHSTRSGQQVEQQLLRLLAMHLAAEMAAMAPWERGPGQLPGPAPLKSVVDRLRATNPGVEVYLLDNAGRIEQRYPESAPLLRQQVTLGPLRDFISGKRAPILGDDPLSLGAQKVFSVATTLDDGAEAGYVYAVLQGSVYDLAASDAWQRGVVQTALWSIGLVAPLGMVAGFLSFRWVTRPLIRLAADVQALTATTHLAAAGDDTEVPPVAVVRQRDEIAILREAFERLQRTNHHHWQSLAQQDQKRREWLAHISHDLRTPLATMQGYLETVLLKSAPLSAVEREHYLRTALSESQRLSRLAQALLDLARLELGAVKPRLETFSIVELAQDVMQKLALSASARQKSLVPDILPGVHSVSADIGMIERVLTNLLDNAIRHTPPGGEIRVRLEREGDRVRVAVADQGPGIPQAMRADLFAQTSQRLPGRDGGGLGLAVVQQMLQLHGSSVQLHDEVGWGAVFVFYLACQA